MSARTGGPGEVRNTRQRRAVAQALASLEDFISTQDLHALLRERGESVSLATTYRLLQSMSELGELDVLRSDDGEAIYRRCGAAVELEAPTVEEWAARTAAHHGFTQLDHTVEITGLCAACSARPADD